MSDEELPEDEEPKKKSKLPLIIGLVLAIAGGGGGFFAVQSGMILAPKEAPADGKEAAKKDLPDATAETAFVALDPLIISVGDPSENRHLRFAAQLEVSPDAQDDVLHLSPRVLDVLNGYLRAVEVSDLEDPTALVRLRAQMLRRIQIVAGEGRVNDLLVTEFVLN